jgi:hypothetical protein
VFETAVLVALLVPLPNKVRLSPVAMRVCGFQLARALSSSALRGIGDITVSCRYEPAVKYLRDALQLGLSTGGIYDLRCRTALSRYIGLIEMTCQGQPVFDVLLDATETEANPFVLACLRRVDLPIPESRWAMQLATALGVRLLN